MLFSTGPPLPAGALRGTVLHWTEQRVLGGALVTAALLPDTVPYLALTDSSGRFALAGVPPGEYLVYAVDDQNGNRRGDRREAYDSVRVRVDSATAVVLWPFAHDSIGPRPRLAEPIDSVTFRVTFTQALDPSAPLDSVIRLFSLPDTPPVSLAVVLPPARYDSLVARERAAADSARAARDTSTARDSAPPARRPDVGRAPFQRPRMGDQAPSGRQPRAPATARGDSATSALLAGRPAPFDRLVVRTAAVLEPGARYLVRVDAALNLNGAVGEGQQVLAVPERAPARAPDSTAGRRP
jgi:hypothetical protein